MGTVYKGFGDGSTAWGVPLKQAVEMGAMSGQLNPWMVDPSPCVGLPGTPETPEQLNAGRAEVERVCMYAIPLTKGGLHAGSLGLAFNGDVTGCVWMKTIGDAVPSICEVAVSTLDVIENPGEPWYAPGVTWDAGWCWL